MSRKARGAKSGRAAAPAPSLAPLDRARALLLRLETSGQKLQNAAEELDRLQSRLERDGNLDEVRARVLDLVAAWADTALRGERGQAWLALVGGFHVLDYVPEVASVLRDSGLPAPIRIQAGHVLAGLGGDEARRALIDALSTTGEPQVRVAAAEALAGMGDRSAAPALAELLEQDLPRPVWVAISEAYERLR